MHDKIQDWEEPPHANSGALREWARQESKSNTTAADLQTHYTPPQPGQRRKAACVLLVLAVVGVAWLVQSCSPPAN